MIDIRTITSVTRLGNRSGAFRMASLLFCLLAATPSHCADAPTKIRLGTLLPKGTSTYRHLQAMGERWRIASSEAITLAIYPDGQMGGEAEMVRRMRVGQLHAGTLTVVGLSDIEPGVAGLQNIPMMFRSLEEVDYVGQKLQPKLEQRLRDKGFEVLAWADAGWVRFFSKNPVMYPDDLKKEKLFVWAGGPVAVDLYKSAGFQAIPLETVDILPNLKTGLITAVPCPPFFALASQIDLSAPHMLSLNWGALVGATVISKRVWDRITPATQEAMKVASREAGVLMKKDNRGESDDAVRAMKERGLKVHEPPEDAIAAWRKVAESTYPRVRGGLVPAEIYDEVVSLLAEYRARPAP